MISPLRSCLLLATVLWPATAMAAYSLNDFAYGLRLAAPAKNSLVRVVLPDTVYRHLAGSEGGDIRVFRLDGQMVAHLLHSKRIEEEIFNFRHLPFEALDRSPTGAGSDRPNQPKISEGDRQPASNGAGEKSVSAPAYLIDIRQLNEDLQALQLSWRRHRPEVLVKARLEGSNDRMRWYPILDSFALADIRYGEQRLQKRAIRLPMDRSGIAFMKLTLLNGGAAITVERIEGLTVPSGQPPERRWIRAAYRSDAVTPGSMQFDSGGLFPVDRIDLKFSQGDGLVTGTVHSRPSEQAIWQIRYQGVFYHLSRADAILHNDPVMLPGNRDRYWKLDIDSPRSDLGHSVPRLMLGGRPDLLFFVTQGAGAYILAYGSRRVPPRAPPPELVRQVEDKGDRAPVVDIGERLVLGGPSRLRGPSGEVPGKMLSLSSLLLGVVLLIAFLAWWVVRRRLA